LELVLIFKLIGKLGIQAGFCVLYNLPAIIRQVENKMTNKNKRFLISLMISLFLNICLINIFSQIFTINDFWENREVPMSVINIELLSSESIQLPIDDIKNQPDFPEKKNLNILSEENNKIENNTAEKPVPQQSMMDMKEEKNVEHEGKTIAVKESEVQIIVETKEEQEQYRENVTEEKTVDREENEAVIDRQSKSNVMYRKESDLSPYTNSQEEQSNEKHRPNEVDTPLDFTGSSEIGNRIVPPKIISFLHPDYPENLRRRAIEGNVQLRVLIDRDGKVVQAEIYNSSGYKNFDKAAIQAIYEWQFEPAKSEYATRESWVLIPIKFKLK
jgi:protein TonB